MCEWRWSELKRGWKRRKGSPRSSRDSSTVENRCEFFHHGPSCSADISLLLFFFETLCVLMFFSQEWWEDGCRLQDPGRLSAASCVGAKRWLNAPQALHTPVLLIMSRCGGGASWVPTLYVSVSLTMSQHREIHAPRPMQTKDLTNNKKRTLQFPL